MVKLSPIKPALLPIAYFHTIDASFDIPSTIVNKISNNSGSKHFSNLGGKHGKLSLKVSIQPVNNTGYP
jgi:hypothetical protein